MATTFHLFVVGCGGGPYENNLSSYLLKPSESSWKDGIIALEAGKGSGLGAINRLLTAHPDVFKSDVESEDSATPTPADIYSWIRCYLITHPHLDHLNGLVLSAGSAQGPSKLVHGTRQTLDVVAEAFSGRLWPALASWTESPEKPLLLSPLSPDDGYVPISEYISVRTMPLSHGPSFTSDTHTDTDTSSVNVTPGGPGPSPAPAPEPYASSAFFLRHARTGHELLFLGDVEPDALSARPRTRDVWRTAAPRVPHALPALFVECSWPAGRPAPRLYGHLSPEHLAAELGVLAREVVAVRARDEPDPGAASDGGTDGESARARRRKRRRTSDAPVDVRGALAGLKVYIIHCKDDLDRAYDRPIHQVIAGQVRDLVEESELGAEVIAVEQGMLIFLTANLNQTQLQPNAQCSLELLRTDSSFPAVALATVSIPTLTVTY
ncbi:cAMP phosphodiesterases class-II-domain-containing protein [Trametes elegans]|nr:cAMP phosphodiesterases class-II-domain-containing protein [Trametes elegans]